MEIEFRVAEKSDVKDIIKLTNECFEEETTLDFAEWIFGESENDPNQIYLNGYLKETGELVAHTKITIIPTIYSPMKTFAILNHVCVKPEYRRHHLGWKLLEAAEKICREKNCVAIELWSKNFRVPAHKLYQKYGFIIEEAKFFAKDLEGGKNEN